MYIIYTRNIYILYIIYIIYIYIPSIRNKATVALLQYELMNSIGINTKDLNSII
jgi:hypothetical protein